MKHNPVAKFAHKANKATVQRDRTKYQRKQKHKGDGRDDRHRPFCWARTADEFRFGLSIYRVMMVGRGGRYP
jgi:hypothetical protein